ncbi:MAG: alpha/beta fold hydrolase [Acidobacteriota bacterium]
MKKRDIALIVGGGIGFAIAWKYVTRPESVDWDDVSHLVPNSDRSRFIDVDGLEIHYQEFGDKSDKTLIFIHGYSASTVTWATAAPEMARRGFRVIALDLVGFGFSEKPDWFEYTIEAQARMVERFMDLLGIGTATIVGHSYGGAVAKTIALDYPERVEKLVSVAGVIDNRPKSHVLMRLGAVPGVGEVSTAFLVDSKIFLARRLAHMIAPANRGIVTTQRVANYQRPLRSAETQSALISTSRNWDADRISEDAELINQPTLLIWGDSDPLIPVHMGEKMFRLVLQSRLVVFKQCGHLIPEEKPAEFIHVLETFCKNPKADLSPS